MEKIECPICKSKKFKLLFTAADLIHKIEGVFRIVKCSSCGLILTNPRPNQEEIKKYYPDSYHCYGLDVRKVERRINIKNKLKLLFKFFDTFANKHPIANDKANVLEIGCGSGEFLYEYRKMYPTHNIKGTDFNVDSLETLKKNGLDVFYSDLKNIDLPENSQDLVLGWMILEHVHNINSALSEIYRILKSDGTFVFSVPNAESWQFSYFCDKWYPLQAPAHLYHFTENTLVKILKKNGFVVERVYHQRSLADVIKSIQHKIDSNLEKSKYLRNMSRAIFSWNLFYLVLTFPFASFFSLIRQSSRITVLVKKQANQ